MKGKLKQAVCSRNVVVHVHATFTLHSTVFFSILCFILTTAAEEVSAQQEHYVIYYPHDEQGTPSAQALSLHIITCR